MYQWDFTSSYHLDAEQQIVFPIDLSDSTTNFLISLTVDCQLLTLLGTDLTHGQSAMLEKIDGSEYIQTIKQTKESARYFLNVSSATACDFTISVESYVEVTSDTSSTVVIDSASGIQALTPSDSLCVVTSSEDEQSALVFSSGSALNFVTGDN